ncbi:protein THEM6 [Periplaneta americana]|uniref:protein THEM6 n=1 Tax=Periplaneta americana TaxID=6978 RepID=UPI0037E8E8D8
MLTFNERPGNGNVESCEGGACLSWRTAGRDPGPATPTSSWHRQLAPLRGRGNMLLCCSCIALVSGVALLYALFDVNYFIRIIFTIGFGRLFQKKVRVLDGSTIYGFCTTQDVDIFLRHMNNARYIRELDFARFHFYDRTNLYREVTKMKGNALQGASYIRYRRTIPIFTAYKVHTKLVYWDEKSIYLEQRFVTLRDGFIRAVILSKQNIVGVDVNDLMVKLIGKDVEKPALPEELDHWLRSIEVSSAKLKKSD